MDYTIMKPLFTLLVAGLFLYGCDSLCNCDNAEENHAPILHEISLDPATVVVWDAIALTAVATDADGDSLQYVWATTGGELYHDHDYSTTSNPTRWTSPAEPGDYSISCTVSDGKEIASKTLAVTVQ